MSDWSGLRAAARKAGRDEILIGGRDLTFFRGAETVWSSYQLTEPFAYGPASLSFPKVNPSLERLGVGDLDWYRPGAEVRLNRRDPDTDELIATDHVGLLLARRAAGRELTVEVGGQFSGRAAMVEKQQRAFRYVGDVGHLAALAIGEMNLIPEPWNGPVTGVKMVDASGGESFDSWSARICAMSLTTDGRQWTIMPTVSGSSVWEFREKDTTTVDCTIFTDDARMVVDLRNDPVEQPNRWFITGTTPGGVRIRNIRYPGLMQGPPAPYPMAGGADITPGTTDADTINLDGIFVLQDKLQQMSYYGWGNPITSVYDAITVAAVKRLQADVNLPKTGVVDTTTWDRLWDITATGSSINGAKVFPVISDPRTEKFLYSASGAVVGLNPVFDASVPPVDRVVNFGPGWTKQQMVDWCRGDQARSAGPNWFGQIALNDFGAWQGEWGPDDAAMLNADPATGYPGRPDLIMSLRDVRPGMNAWLPQFDGGILVHISAVTPQRSGPNISANLIVDTQARDGLEVSALIARDAEARRDPRREFFASRRAAKPSGNMVPRDEFFGRLAQKRALPGGKWTAILMPAGQAGQINRVHVQLVNAQTPFAMVILGEGRSEEAVAKELDRRIGNPLATVSGRPWWKRAGNAAWFRKRTILYAAGTHNQPCGYWPDELTDTNGPTGADVTGEWIYDNPFPYLTGELSPGVVWVAIYPQDDTHVKAGQMLWAQEDDVN